MLTFNDLLQLDGIDPATVRLVRNQDGRIGPGRLHEAWRNDREAFENYVAVQSKNRFALGDVLAEFVVSDAGKTVFVGLYRVDDVQACLAGSRDALLDQDISGLFRYGLTLLDQMDSFRGRLVIAWGAATRAWAQRAQNQPKPVVEIADQLEPRFPGFRQFVRPIADVPTLPNSWQQVLRSVKGIYLLVDLDSGKQYVGSAKGAESLFGRWLQYAMDGHGGNLELKKAAAQGKRRYQVSVLEVVDINTSDDTIEQIESFWKRKLLSPTFGLNAN